MENMHKVPWWFTAIAVVTALPALRLPWIWAAETGLYKVLTMFYPCIIALGAYIAYRCYAQERKETAWILIAVCWLCTLAIPFLSPE